MGASHRTISLCANAVLTVAMARCKLATDLQTLIHSDVYEHSFRMIQAKMLTREKK